MKKILAIFLTGLILPGFAMAQDPAGPGRQQTGNDFVEGALYIQFKEGYHEYTPSKSLYGGRIVSSQELFPSAKGTGTDDKLSAFGLENEAFSLHFQDKLDRTYRLSFSQTDKTEALIRYLDSLPYVEYVERIPQNHLCSPGSWPDDPLVQDGREINGRWFLEQIGFDNIYGKYQGKPEVKVAVVDNAVWAGHPDLDILPENRYFAFVDAEGECEPPTNVDQDEACTGLSNCMAFKWSHGTHCAGLIAAQNDNGEGTASFASGITLLAARASDLNEDGVSMGYECILWALEKGADIISLSWGSTQWSRTHEDIIETALENGTIIVAAAGNDNADRAQYPAQYDGVIAVGAVNADNSRASFSNYGSWVDVAAPGGYTMEDGKESSVTILSTTYSASTYYRLLGMHELDGMYYDGLAGTSMATPVTASVIALMKSVNPDLGPAQAEQILKETSVPAIDFEMDPNSGVIQADKAVEAAAQAAGNTTGISTTLQVLPNPASDFIRIQGIGNISQLRAYNTCGQLLESWSRPGKQVSLEDLPSGLLILEIESPTQTFVTKIIKH